MKIVLLTNLYEPYARGGAEVIVKRSAEELLRQGFEVSIITACPLGAAVKELKKRNVAAEEEGRQSASLPEGTLGAAHNVDAPKRPLAPKIIRYYPGNIFFYGHDYKWPVFIRAIWHLIDIFNLQSALEMHQLLKQEKPDLVISHNLIGLGFFIPVIIRRLGIKHLHVLHDIQLAVRSGVMRQGQESGLFVSGVLARAYQAIAKKLFGSPKVVISPSNFLLDFYTSRGYFPSSNCQILRNPIDSRFFLALNQPSEAKQLRFAYIGQLEPQKGVEGLIEAFEGLKNAQLHFVGAGQLEATVDKWAKQPVKAGESGGRFFHGRIANEKLPEFLSKVDVLVLPTLIYENSPTVVYEALAAGVPVIVSDLGGAAELVEQGVNGYKVPAGDVAALREAMQKLIDQPSQIKKMSQAAQESVRDFTSEKYVEELMRLF